MSFENFLRTIVLENDHSVLATKDLDLAFLFQHGEINPLIELNKFFIVVSKSVRNPVIDYDLKTVKFTSNIEDVILYRNIESEEFSGFACLVAPDIGMIDSIKLASEFISNIEYAYIDDLLDYSPLKKKGLYKDLISAKIKKSSFEKFRNASNTSDRLHSLGYLDCISSDEILEGTLKSLDILVKSNNSEYKDFILNLLENDQKEHFLEILQIFSEYYLPGEERNILTNLIQDSKHAELLENLEFGSNLDSFKFDITNSVYKNKNVFYLSDDFLEFKSNLSMIEILKDIDTVNVQSFNYELENSILEINNITGFHEFSIKHEILSPKYFKVVFLNTQAQGLYYSASGRLEHFDFGNKIDIERFKSGDKVVLMTNVDARIRSNNDIYFKEIWKNEAFKITDVSNLMHQSENIKIFVDGLNTEILLNYNDQNIDNVLFATQLGVVRAEDSDKYRLKESSNRINIITPQHQILDWISYNMLVDSNVYQYFNLTNYTFEINLNVDKYEVSDNISFFGDISEEILSSLEENDYSELVRYHKEICHYLLKDVSSFEEYKQKIYENILIIPDKLINEYYHTYTNFLKDNRAKFLDFCVIKLYNVEGNINECGIYMPCFHPVNLYDICSYFRNKHTFIWIASNKYYRSILMRKDVTRPLIGYVSDILEGVLYCQKDQVDDLQNKFGINNLSSIVSPKSSSLDQIYQSLISLHEYLGFSKVLNLFIVTEERHHIEELFKYIVDSKFGNHIEYNIYTNCSLSSSPYLFGIEEKSISLYTDCIINGSYDLVIDLSNTQLNDVDFSRENFENNLRVDLGFFRNKHYQFEQYYYKEFLGFSKELKGHELLYNLSGNDNSVVLKYRNNSDIVKLLEKSKLFSTNRFRFNEYVKENRVFIYEMRVENNLNTDNVGNNFFIGVNNSNQLKKHISEILSEFCLVDDDPDKTERLSNLILNERLFSFRSLLGNSNKLKGVVGELAFYFSYKQRSIDFCDSLIIPIDLIYERLKLFFNISNRPDFIILKFTDDSLEFFLVEVKSYKSITNSKLYEIYNEQLKPLNEELYKFITRSSAESKLDMVVNLIEFGISNLSYDFLTNSIPINDWILSADKKVNIGKPLIVTYENERESYSTSINEFNHVKFNYCNSIDSFESLDSDLYSTLFTNNSGQILIPTDEFNDRGIDLKETDVFVLKDDSIDEKVEFEDSNSYDGNADRNALSDSNTDVKDDMSVKYQNVKQWLRRKNIYLDLSDKGYSMGPMIVRFYYKLNTQRSSLKDLNSVILDLGIYLELNDGQRVISGYDSGEIYLDIPMKERRFYQYSELLNYEEFEEFGLSVVIGVDNLNQPVHMDFADSNSPHILIAGTTGSGKSIAIETILGGLLKKYKSSELLVSIVDPKGVEFVNFEDFDQIKNSGLSEGIVEDADGALELLENAIIEMERRKHLFRNVRARSLKEYNEIQENPLPRHLIIIDEYAVLVSDRNYRNMLEDKLKVIAQKARFAGIHLLIATQKPTAEVINTVIKSNLPSRLALKVSSNTDSQVILDEVGAENLLGKGDAIFLFDGQHKIRLQICKFDMYTDD